MLSQTLKWPLWNLGFRPFFFLASFFAAVLLLLWQFRLQGAISFAPSWAPKSWHGHEMIFGFTSAVIVGFLLTAGQNWSGIRGVHGAKLTVLTLVWLIARIGLLLPTPYLWAGVLADLFFLPVATVLLLPSIWNANGTRNRKVVLLLVLYSAANIIFHLKSLGVTLPTVNDGILFGLDVILGFLVLIAGRVIPFFSSRALATRKVEAKAWLETSMVILFAGYLTTGIFGFSETRTIFALLLGGTHFYRWFRWKPYLSYKTPLLWILYSGYLWLIIGFILEGLAPRLHLWPSLSTHAFTVGGIGCLAYGMMARVSLGHSGRPLKPPLWLSGGFILINLSALLRVLAQAAGQDGLAVIQISGTLWTVAYLGLFLFLYPILTKPRADGKPG